MGNIYQRKLFYLFIGLICLLNVLGVILCYFYSNTAMADEMEHLRASWFVSQGYLPYRDFFEHHHPLLWFGWSPLMKILPQKFDYAWYTARFAAALFSIGSLTVFFFWVKRFFGGVKTACLAICFSFMIYVNWYTFSIFKPDTFARFFYMLGLYEFFAFCQNKKTKDLVWCGVNFTISFLFLQTLIFSILPLMFPTIWLLYKKQISWKALVIAAVIPLLMFLAALIFLSLTDSLSAYFQLNWVFNSYLFKVSQFHNNPVIYFYGIYIFMAVASSLFLIIKRKTDFNINVVIMLFWGELFHLLYFSAVWPHYFVYLFIFSAVIWALTFQYITDGVFINTTKLCLIAGIAINASMLYVLYVHNNKSILKIMNIMNIIENSENKTVLNCIDVFYVWEPLHHYYWFYPNIEVVDSVLHNRYPEFDINEYLQSNKIEYISMDKNIKCDAVLEENALPPDNRKNLQNFSIRPEVYDKYEEIYSGFYKRKADF